MVGGAKPVNHFICAMERERRHVNAVAFLCCGWVLWWRVGGFGVVLQLLEMMGLRTSTFLSTSSSHCKFIQNAPTWLSMLRYSLPSQHSLLICLSFHSLPNFHHPLLSLLPSHPFSCFNPSHHIIPHILFSHLPKASNPLFLHFHHCILPISEGFKQKVSDILVFGTTNRKTTTIL